MSFDGDIARWAERAKARGQAVFTGFVTACWDSIVDGSPVTGAPGQPVKSEKLKRSWTEEYPAPTRAVISTDLPYAPLIEDGMGAQGPLTLDSPQGGFHSLKLTVAGAERLLDDVLRRVPA